MPDALPNPAQVAAQEAWAQLQACLDQRHSFIFEAGAGAGKTYSLIEALRYCLVPSIEYSLSSKKGPHKLLVSV